MYSQSLSCTEEHWKTFSVLSCLWELRSPKRFISALCVCAATERITYIEQGNI